MGSSHVKKRFSDPRTQQKRTASTKDFMKKQHEIKHQDENLRKILGNVSLLPNEKDFAFLLDILTIRHSS